MDTSDIAARIREKLATIARHVHDCDLCSTCCSQRPLLALLDVLDLLAGRRSRSGAALAEAIHSRIAETLEPPGMRTPMEWRPVRGYETSYEVSDTGSVRRIKGGRGAVVGRVLKPYLGSGGYPTVTLHTPGARVKAALVHRLLAEAFLPDPNAGEDQVNHLDGDKCNNRMENLEWVTLAENNRHAFRTGLNTPRAGEKNGKAKLTWADVAAIRASDMPAAVLSGAYGVSKHAIYRIRNGTRWASRASGEVAR